MLNFSRIKIRILVLLFALLCAATHLSSYTFTREAALLDTDKFLFDVGVAEYYKAQSGSVFVLPITIHLGLAKRVEFIGIFPYIQLRQEFTGELDTFGDILLYLKFKMNNFYYNFPFLNVPAFNQFDLVVMFNTATGPSREEMEEFSPYSTGLPDFSLGFFYGKMISDFSLDLNFIYTFAAHIGEEYLPFSDSIWNSSKQSYFFDIHKVFVKFFWPSRYPWAKKEAAKWERYPHIDDYFHLDLGFNYLVEPDWSLFSYDFFLELNWLRSWSSESIFQERLLLTPGVQVNITENFLVVASASFLVKPNTIFFRINKGFLYRTPRDFYYDRLYYIGLRFLL
ncbi:MAG: hypothetical protein PHF84_05425 [bacterium]|nr:hypothetical protein [bacterium]